MPPKLLARNPKNWDLAGINNTADETVQGQLNNVIPYTCLETLCAERFNLYYALLPYCPPQPDPPVLL